MNHIVKTSLLRDVPGDLYAQMYALNHGIIGRMRRTVSTFRASNCPFTRVFYVTNGEKLLGWSLVFPKKFAGTTDATYEIHFYVGKVHRLNGIGSALAKELRIFYSDTKIGGHPEYSTIMKRHDIPSVYSL